MRNWDSRETHVQVNVQFKIWLVQLPIWWVTTPIRGLLNPIRQVVPLMSHFCSSPPYHSHPHPPSLFLFHNSTIITEHKVRTFLSMSPCDDYELTLSAQHTPHTVYTEDCLCSLYFHKYELAPECSFHFRHASLQDQPSPMASSPGESTEVKWPCHIPKVAN